MFYFLKHLSNKLAIITYISVQSEAFQFSYVVSSAIVHLKISLVCFLFDVTIQLHIDINLVYFFLPMYLNSQLCV